MWNIPKCFRFFLFLRFPLENKSGRPKQTNAKGVWPMRTLICQHLRFVVTCRMHSKRGVGGRAYYFVYLRCSYFHPFVFFPQLNVEKKKKKTGLKRRGGRPLFALYRTPISYIFLLSFPFFLSCCLPVQPKEVGGFFNLFTQFFLLKTREEGAHFDVLSFRLQ